MPIHLYWGEEEFLLHRAIKQLRSQILNEQWASFNYTEYPPDSKDSISQAFADVNTPPVGSGGRLVYLPNSALLGVCPKEMVEQLEHTLPNIPETNILLITSTKKPDGRNRSVKLLLECIEIREFPLIPQWQTDALMQQTQNLAKEMGVNLTTDATQLLVNAVNNNTQLLSTELQKLKTYTNGQTVNADAIKDLVLHSATNSLQLAAAIRTRNVSLALELVENLIRCNEPALKIVATLTTTFRTWLIVKLCIAAGWKDDSAIASLAELKNPKRLYFLRQEVANVTVGKLQNALQVLLELELMLKSGADAKVCLLPQVIKVCT